MQIHRLLGGVALAALAASTLTPVGKAWPFLYSDWNARYPNSQTDDNISAGGGSQCQVCHRDPNGGQPWNAYGWRLRLEFLATGDFQTAMTNAEPLDSDLDPTASTNLEEIDASTQPGWTVGPNNTNYYADGTSDTGQLPPGVILGDLDPPGTLGTNYCGPAVPGSSGTSAVIAATGSIVAGDNDFTLHASGMPQNQFGYFLASENQGLFSPPASAGFICLGGNIGRYSGNVQNSGSGGSFSLTLDLNSIPVNPIQAVAAGDAWNFQCWFRDAPTNNFTDGLNVVFQ